jgi:integrase
MFEHRVKAAGVPIIRFHDLRHTYISIAREGGEAVEVLSERVGHATVAFTLDRYRHIGAGEQRETAQRVAERVFGATRGR